MDLIPQTPGDGQSTGRRVAFNSSLLLLAYGLQAVVSVILVGVVARYLGQAGLGRYGYVISYITLFTSFIDLGMNRILVREISRKRDAADLYASIVWTLRLLLFLAVLALVGLTSATQGSGELWLAIVIFCVAQGLFLLADVFNAVFHGHQRMEYEFYSVLLDQFLYLMLTVAAIQLNLGLVGLFVARLVAHTVKLQYVAWVSRRRFARARFTGRLVTDALAGLRNPRAFWQSLQIWHSSLAGQLPEESPPSGGTASLPWRDVGVAWHMSLESIPLGISIVLRNYIWRGGLVLMVFWLGQQQGDLANGLLYGPLRIVEQMRIVPTAFAAAMLPVFSSRARDRLEAFDRAFANSFKLILVLSILIALAFNILADPIVSLVLGKNIDLAGAAQVLSLMGLIIVFYFPNRLYGVTLVASGRQWLETLGLALGLVAGFFVVRWTIPDLGALGVAYGILVAEGLLFVVGTAAMWHRFHWRKQAPSLIKILLASGAAGLVFATGARLWDRLIGDATGLGVAWLAGSSAVMRAVLELALVGGLGLLAFGLALVLLRTFDRQEIEALRGIVRPQRART